MDLATFLVATLIAHIGFAICITAHATLTGRDAGNWPFITLALGLAGVAGYVFYEPNESGPV